MSGRVKHAEYLREPPIVYSVAHNTFLSTIISTQIYR
jgi:hypothetical protein